MATNVNYAEAEKVYSKARYDLQLTRERHKQELERAVKAEQLAYDAMVAARDAPDNWK